MPPSAKSANAIRIARYRDNKRYREAVSEMAREMLTEMVHEMRPIIIQWVEEHFRNAPRNGPPPIGSPFPDKEKGTQKEITPTPSSPTLFEFSNENSGGTPCRRVYVIDFKRFWEVWPGRGGLADPKKPAATKFALKVKAGARSEDIIRGAERYAARIAEQKLEPQFVPQAVKWLTDHRWDQEEAKPNGHNPIQAIDPEERERLRQEARERVLALTRSLRDAEQESDAAGRREND